MSNYHEEEKQKNILLLREQMKILPPFLNEFFRGISQTTSVKTKLAYAYDLKLFFSYIIENHAKFKKKTFSKIVISDLNKINSDDIDRFMEYLTYYIKTNPKKPLRSLKHQNDERGKSRKLAAIRSMYKFFYKKGKIDANPATIVDTPKIHDKVIVRLDVNEVASLLDEVDSGENLTERQKIFHAYSRNRDLALITLLLGTGMRVSECVGINLEDIDFKNNGVKVTRKGGNEVVLYFGSEVQEALQTYIKERKETMAEAKDKEALFLSNRKTRITVRAVENLVKKYSLLVTNVKKISPHKLRSTYATNLYNETGDIYLVAEVLGHADVNTTRKHYAQIEEERRRRAAKYIKLRKD